MKTPQGSVFCAAGLFLLLGGVLRVSSQGFDTSKFKDQFKSMKEDAQKADLQRSQDAAASAAANPQAEGDAKIMERLLTERGQSTSGGRFFSGQCSIMEKDQKTPCMEHALAVDMKSDAAKSAYYEIGSDGLFYKLTPKGLEFVRAGAKDPASPVASASASSGPVSQADVDACLDSVGQNQGGGKKAMTQRALFAMQQQCSGDAQCAKDRTAQWYTANCRTTFAKR